jgi:hypothetical protein
MHQYLIYVGWFFTAGLLVFGILAIMAGDTKNGSINLLLALAMIWFWRYIKVRFDETAQKQAEEQAEAERQLAEEAAEAAYAGRKLLKKLSLVRLTEVLEEYNGKTSIETMASLAAGDEVILKRMTQKESPNAILVVDLTDAPVGWIPEDYPHQKYLARHLDKGAEVEARINSVMGGGESGKPLVALIDLDVYQGDEQSVN